MKEEDIKEALLSYDEKLVIIEMIDKYNEISIYTGYFKFSNCERFFKVKDYTYAISLLDEDYTTIIIAEYGKGLKISNVKKIK